MTKLTDAQLMVLSQAAAREDGAAVAPPKMNRAAAAKVGSSLIARKLMREIRCKPGMPVWREAENGRPASVIITRAGRVAIGVDRVAKTNQPALDKGSDEKAVGRRPSVAAPRPGSKQALVVGMHKARRSRPWLKPPAGCRTRREQP